MRAYEVLQSLFFLKIGMKICSCLVLNFHPGLEKCQLYGKFDIFIPF